MGGMVGLVLGVVVHCGDVTLVGCRNAYTVPGVGWQAREVPSMAQMPFSLTGRT